MTLVCLLFQVFQNELLENISFHEFSLEFQVRNNEDSLRDLDIYGLQRLDQ